MRYAVLFIAAVVLASGCTWMAPQDQELFRTWPGQNILTQNHSENITQQFGQLVNDWNSIARMKLAKTQQGFSIYFDARLDSVVPECNKMMPTFNCTDILLGYKPSQDDLQAGDIVSFEIRQDEAQAFSEEPFTGTKIIFRRIFRVGNDSSYYIMKRDASATTHTVHITFDRIREKFTGFIFEANLAENNLEPYSGSIVSVQDYNKLVDRWNVFVGNVYAAKMAGNYPLYYDKRMTVPALACTGSMRPTIDCNDLIFAYKPLSEGELRAGNIVSFRIAPNETAGFLEAPSRGVIHVMHRIYRATQAQNTTAFITKGDNPETNYQTDAIYLNFSRIETKIAAYFKDSYNVTFSNH
jgi:hypothetical protein